MSKISLTLAMPNFNHAAYLKKSISGMIGQTRRADEILILDDASTDNSLTIIEHEVRNETNVRLIPSPSNNGVIKGLNRLLSETSSDWVCFPAADDFLFPDFLSQAEKLIHKSDQIGFVSASLEVWDENDRRVGVRPIFYPSLSPRIFSPKEAKKLLVQSDNHFMGQVTLYRTAFLRELGGFDERFGSGTDGMVLRQLALLHGFGFTPDRSGIWRLHGDNFSVSSGLDTLKYQKMIDIHRRFIEEAPEGLFPTGYGDLLERRMKFGVARLIFGENKELGEKIGRTSDLIGAGPVERHLLNMFGKVGPFCRTFVQAWVFLKCRPFSLLRFSAQPLRRGFAEMSVARRTD
jgi:glycosyltransferase involved in cell wall biosynthesis